MPATSLLFEVRLKHQDYHSPLTYAPSSGGSSRAFANKLFNQPRLETAGATGASSKVAPSTLSPLSAHRPMPVQAPSVHLPGERLYGSAMCWQPVVPCATRLI
jgi:hypothetical protein